LFYWSGEKNSGEAWIKNLLKKIINSSFERRKREKEVIIGKALSETPLLRKILSRQKEIKARLFEASKLKFVISLIFLLNFSLRVDKKTDLFKICFDQNLKCFRKITWKDYWGRPLVVNIGFLSFESSKIFFSQRISEYFFLWNFSSSQTTS